MIRTLLTASIVLAAATSASAQNALDHNLQRGPGASRINPAAPTVDYRARNEDVTGTLAGGRSFRGNVGYRPSDDFWAPVGADSIQRSLSNSAYSDPALFNSPLRNDQFRVADGLGVYQFRREYTQTPLYTNVRQVEGLVERQIRLDRSTAAIMSGNLYGTAVGTTQLGMVRDAERGSSLVSASPLRGVRSQPITDPLLGINVSPFDRARLVEDMRAGSIAAAQVGVPYFNPLAPREEDLQVQSVPESMRTGARVEGGMGGAIDPSLAGGRLEGRRPGTDPAYERIVAKIIEQYADRDDIDVVADSRVVEAIREQLEALRMNLRGDLDDATPGSDEASVREGDGVLLPGDELGDPAQIDPNATTQPGRLAGGTARLPGLGDRGRDPLADPRDDEDPLAAIPQERTLSIEEMAEVLRHGRLVESLTEGERNRVRELIEEGQSLVAKADYFKAERRFESALRMQPDHPMATAGLASAQIGAGLYLSAGLTLRKLFTDYPEMIDTRYAEGIIPSRQRLEAVAEVCRNRMTMGRDSAGYGLVVAFIGHQLEMPSLIKDGLLPMLDDNTTRPLAEILRAVWLGGDEPGK
jgi:hypothetical protein